MTRAFFDKCTFEGITMDSTVPREHIETMKLYAPRTLDRLGAPRFGQYDGPVFPHPCTAICSDLQREETWWMNRDKDKAERLHSAKRWFERRLATILDA